MQCSHLIITQWWANTKTILQVSICLFGPVSVLLMAYMEPFCYHVMNITGNDITDESFRELNDCVFPMISLLNIPDVCMKCHNYSRSSNCESYKADFYEWPHVLLTLKERNHSNQFKFEVNKCLRVSHVPAEREWVWMWAFCEWGKSIPSTSTLVSSSSSVLSNPTSINSCVSCMLGFSSFNTSAQWICFGFNHKFMMLSFWCHSSFPVLWLVSQMTTKWLPARRSHQNCFTLLWWRTAFKFLLRCRLLEKQEQNFSNILLLSIWCPNSPN